MLCLFVLQIYPIVNFPEPSISEGSRACIEQHRMQFASKSRIIIQVSRTKVKYRNGWGTFHVKRVPDQVLPVITMDPLTFSVMLRAF